MPVCEHCLREPDPLIAEFFCASCRAPFVNRFPLDENGQCMLCRLGLTGFDAAYSYGSYEGALRTLIHLFKYEKVYTLARPLGNLLARVLPRENRYDCVVPMPLHWRRRWTRGFNQSELLAREIARRWGVPVTHAVKRVKATASQAGLTNAKRRANMTAAFAPQRNLLAGVFGKLAGLGTLNREFLKNKRVLLVDDVFTTGATAAACARVLKQAGAAHVALLTVARTDRRLGFSERELSNQVRSNRDRSNQAASTAGAGSGTP